MPTPMEPAALERQYWRKNLRMTAALLAVWFVVTFVLSFFARDLSFVIFGWPFSFWMAAQGSLIVYCLIIWGHACYMRRLDAEHGMGDDEGVAGGQRDRRTD